MFEELLRASDEDKMRFIAAVMKASEAGRLLDAGDHRAGIAAYREAIEICPLCPTRGDYHVLLGYHFFAEGDAAAAEAELMQALVGHGCSHPHEAYRRLGLARAGQGRFGEALADMAQAAELGEDAAFVAQAMATYHLAQGELDQARAIAADRPNFGAWDGEARQRLALARAEIARLTSDGPGFVAACEQVAKLAADDGMSSELALWLAVLDRLAGRTDLRDVVTAAFAEQKDWAEKAWSGLLAQASSAILLPDMEALSWGERSENLAQYHRLAGLLAEHEGDLTSARKHYEKARIEPFTQWCIDYHLAGIGLERLGAA